MSLLLGVTTNHCIVVAADGFSIRTYYEGKRKVVERTDLRKIFPINRATAVLHFGENVLRDSTVASIIGEHAEALARAPNPHAVRDELVAVFSPRLAGLEGSLEASGNDFGLWVASYRDRKPSLHEIHWSRSLERF